MLCISISQMEVITNEIGFEEYVVINRLPDF